MLLSSFSTTIIGTVLLKIFLLFLCSLELGVYSPNMPTVLQWFLDPELAPRTWLTFKMTSITGMPMPALIGLAALLLICGILADLASSLRNKCQTAQGALL